MEKLIELDKICYSAHTKKSKYEPKILDDINLNIHRNEIIGIAGKSGCGKTTLGKIIAGLVSPTSGKIKFFTEQEKKPNIQILFQNTGMIINPYRKVIDLIKEAEKIGGASNSEQINDIIDLLKIPEKILFSRGFQLSGGERQRVAMARILAVKPEVIILDEPFSSQDPESKLRFKEIFKIINKKFGITLIIISHELFLFRELATRMCIMHKGKILETADANKILNDPDEEYTRLLIKAENFTLGKDETDLFH